MAEETLPKPVPPRVESWRIPEVIRIEGDGINPRNTKLMDAQTGEPLQLPIHTLQFNVTADEPNSMVITLAGVALRADVHHVHVEISEEDLARVARMSGHTITRAPAYPARLVSYGPAEHQVRFRDFPDLMVTKANPANQATIRMAEAALERALASHEGVDFAPEPSELQDGEFLVYALPSLD